MRLGFGVKVLGRPGMKSHDKEVYKEWESAETEEEAGAEKEMAGAESAFVSTMQTTEEGVALTKGMKPPGVQTKKYLDKKTGWLTTVHVWIPASDELLDQIRKARPGGPGAKPGKPGYDPKAKGPSGKVGKDPRKKRKSPDEE